MTSMVIAPNPTQEISQQQVSIAERLAGFAVAFQVADIPSPVLERARYLILDAVGNALASTTFVPPARVTSHSS